MARSTIKIDISGLSEMINAMHEVHNEGIRRAQTDLDEALDRAAETSRGLVHHDGGSLRASHRTASESGPARWTGRAPTELDVPRRTGAGGRSPG